jgi:hypothetical protein
MQAPEHLRRYPLRRVQITKCSTHSVEQAMSEMPRMDPADVLSILTWPFGQAGSGAARQFSNQGQVVTRALTDWSAEMNRLVTHRMSQNTEAIGQITKCQSLLEVVAIQAHWLQEAMDDFVKAASSLIEINGRMIGGLVGESVEIDKRSSPGKAPAKTAG